MVCKELVITSDDILSSSHLTNDPSIKILEVKRIDVNDYNDIKVNDDWYIILKLQKFVDCSVIICRKISDHSNKDNDPKNAIYEEDACICPSCGYFLDKVHKLTDRCPKCDQIINW